MTSWIYIKTEEEEKLIRGRVDLSVAGGPGLWVSEGGVLVRTGLNQSLQKPFRPHWKKLLSPISLLLPGLMVLLMAKSQPAISEPTSPSSPLPAVSMQSEAKVVISPTPTPTPVPEPTIQPLPKVSQKEIKEIKPKAKSHLKVRKRKLRSQKSGKTSSRKWKEIRTKIQKVFLAGKLDRAQTMLEMIAKKEGGELPKSLWKQEAELAYAKCRISVRQKKWKDAVRQCETATSKQPHARAAALLEELGTMAEKSYLEGYVMEGTNHRAALRRYQAAMAMAPTGHPYGEKARQKLKSLDPSSVH